MNTNYLQENDNAIIIATCRLYADDNEAISQTKRTSFIKT